MPKLAHVIAAAGVGSRFGAPMPKQFCDLDGRPLLMTTIERMRQALPGVIVLVLSQGMIDEWLDMCIEHGFQSPAIAEGGATRWESVRNALKAIPQSVDIITVHDGARPVVVAEVAESVVRRVSDGLDGAIPCIAVTDSVRRVEADGASYPVDRAVLRAVQTPQAFNAEKLRKAYELPYSPAFTDDATVMEAAGFSNICIVEGDPRCIKVTRPGDIEIAQIYLRTLG